MQTKPCPFFHVRPLVHLDGRQLFERTPPTMFDTLPEGVSRFVVAVALEIPIMDNSGREQRIPHQFMVDLPASDAAEAFASAQKKIEEAVPLHIEKFRNELKKKSLSHLN